MPSWRITCAACGEQFDTHEQYYWNVEPADYRCSDCSPRLSANTAYHPGSFKTLKDAAKKTSRKKAPSRAARIAARRRFVTDD
jgi:DNA-directed RNA polymerase subunit RPC12/RpoP